MIQVLKLSSSWSETKDRIKENDLSITDEDLEYEPGQEEQLLSRLQLKMNKSREDVRIWIEVLSANKPRAG